jgi:hypothetical protein
MGIITLATVAALAFSGGFAFGLFAARWMFADISAFLAQPTPEEKRMLDEAIEAGWFDPPALAACDDEPSPRSPAADFADAFVLSEESREAQRQRQESYLRVRSDDDGDDVRPVAGMRRPQCPGGVCPNRRPN